MCWTPSSSSRRSNGPTERAQMKSCSLEMDIAEDGGGHLLRTNKLLCRGMRKRKSFVLIRLTRPKILDVPYTFCYLGTERTTMNSLVPFRSDPQRRELRHALRILLA